MKSILASAPIALAVFVSGCVEPKDISRQVPVSGKFYSTGVEWNVGNNGIDVLWTVIESPDGFVEICGAYDSYGTEVGQYNYGIMRGYSVTVNGTTVLNDFTYFTKVGSKSEFRTAAANCKSTSMPWPKGKFEIGLANATLGKRYKI